MPCPTLLYPCSHPSSNPHNKEPQHTHHHRHPGRPRNSKRRHPQRPCSTRSRRTALRRATPGPGAAHLGLARRGQARDSRLVDLDAARARGGLGRIRRQHGAGGVAVPGPAGGERRGHRDGFGGDVEGGAELGRAGLVGGGGGDGVHGLGAVLEGEVEGVGGVAADEGGFGARAGGGEGVVGAAGPVDGPFEGEATLGGVQLHGLVEVVVEEEGVGGGGREVVPLHPAAPADDGVRVVEAGVVVVVLVVEVEGDVDADEACEGGVLDREHDG